MVFLLLIDTKAHLLLPKVGDITMWKDTLIDVFDDEDRAHKHGTIFCLVLTKPR
jgi:hypothetical protein